MTISTGFFWTELGAAGLQPGRWFDGIAFGEFTDMLGRTVKIDREDAPAIVANTKEAIEATRTESGELVGLPIDGSSHDKGEAAGWIVDVRLAGDIVQFLANWTELGIEKIGKGLLRGFSPTINLRDKIALGGSLTNWLASTDKRGVIKLRPIELSQSMRAFAPAEIHPGPSGGKEVNMSEQELYAGEVPVVNGATAPAAPVAELSNEVQALLAQQRSEIMAELQAQFNAKVAEMKAEQRRAYVSNFAADITGGGDTGKGLAVPADEVEQALAGLTEAQQDRVMTLLSTVRDSGVIDFGAKGHGRKVQGKTPLPAFYAAKLNSGDITLADLSSNLIAPDLGDLADYDLTPWKEEN